MNKILLDGEEVRQFVKESLPTLIHGEDVSGASLYTVSLAANFYARGFPILFLCGFSMAEDEFVKQGGNYDNGKVQFYTKEKVEEFKEILASENTDDQVIVIKNIELFEEDVFGLIASKENVVISGDINKSSFMQAILDKEFTTQIYFSPLMDTELPALNKYEGFVVSGGYKGVTSLQS